MEISLWSVFVFRCKRCGCVTANREKSFITSVYVSPSPVPCSSSPISSFNRVSRNLKECMKYNTDTELSFEMLLTK